MPPDFSKYRNYHNVPMMSPRLLLLNSGSSAKKSLLAGSKNVRDQAL